MQAINLAKAYNCATGSNITHADVLEWGIKEEASIIAALEVASML